MKEFIFLFLIPLIFSLLTKRAVGQKGGGNMQQITDLFGEKLCTN